MPFQVYMSYTRHPQNITSTGSFDANAEIPAWAHNAVYVSSGSPFTSYHAATASVSASHAAKLDELTGVSVSETYEDRRNASTSNGFWYAAPKEGDFIIVETIYGTATVYDTAYNRTQEYLLGGDIGGLEALSDELYKDKRYSSLPPGPAQVQEPDSNPAG